MGQKTNLTQVTVQGLATNPNPNALPAGSCAYANNVTIRRPGMLAPMMQDHDVATVEDELGTVVKAMYDDHTKQLVAVVVDTPNSVSELTTGALYPYTPALPNFTPGTRLALIHTNWDGSAVRSVGFLPGKTQTAFNHFRQLVTEKWGVIVNRERFAGLTSPTIAALDSDPSGVQWLTDGNSVAYRITYSLEYSGSGQNYVLEGPPSSVSGFYNDTGADCGIGLIFAFPKDEPMMLYGSFVFPGQTLYLNVYRTPQSAVATVADLPDEFRRVAKIKLTALDSLIYVDNVSEDAQAGGEPLYTNPSQEGPDQASYAPPTASDVCVFKDNTFYANRSAFPTRTLSIPGTYGTLLTAEDRTYGIGIRPSIGGAATTSGSPVITLTSAADAVGLVPGMGLADGIFPANTYVVSVVGTAVTMSANANSTHTGVAFDFYDMITIRQTFSDGTTTTVSGRVVFFDYDMYTQSTRGLRLLHSVADAHRNVPSAQLTAINIYPALMRCTLLEIFVTNGQNYSPAYTGNYLTLTTPLTSLIDERPNLVFVSKTGQPESVPVANQFQIGAGSILKMWATQSALFFFCTDGLWKITGDDISNFQVSQVDPTVFLTHPDCVTSLNNQIYAWITDGIALVGENGAQTISTDAIGPEVRSVATELFGQVASGLSFWGPAMVGDSYFNEVWINARAALNNELPPGNGWLQTWVYNDDTKNFTTQDHQYVALAYLPVATRIAFIRNDGSDTHVQVQSDYNLDQFGIVARGAEVWFNPLQTEDKGNLKQWMDLYFFLSDYTENPDGLHDDELKALFDAGGDMTDATADTVNVRNIYVTRRTPHYWVPRRAALGDQLQVGFRSIAPDAPDDDTAFYFQLQGFKLRYRVSSDMLKR